MIRVGIVGCGNIGKVHAEVLKNMEEVQIEAFVDKNLINASRYSKLYGTEKTCSYTSLSQMFDEEKIDVLHICTPHSLHVPMAKEALKRNVHVFMEKPPAISEKDFLSLKNAKKNSEKEVGICFQNRYNETTEKVYDILKKKKLGNVLGARAFVTWKRQREYYESSGWRGKWDTEGGGLLINQAIHTLDLLTYFFGEVKGVEVSMHNHHLKDVIEVEDTVEAYMTFQFGTVCFYATSAYAEDSPVLLDIVCEEGHIRMEGDRLNIWNRNGNKITYNFAGHGVCMGKKYWGNSHGACIQDFYDCIETHRIYRNDLESVENTMSVMFKMYNSIKR